jgi:hypothetical protein
MGRNKTRKKKAKKTPRNAGLVMGFISAAVFLMGVVWFLPVRYAINDEFGIIVKTLHQHGADPYSPFLISQVLHYVLYLLYQHWPSIPWLGMFMYFAVYLGSSLMLSLLFRVADVKYAVIVVAPMALLLGYCLSFISVTSASLILEFAVFLCLLEWVIKGNCPQKRPGLYAFLLAFCFLLSYVFRWRLALYSLFFVVPVLFFVKKAQFRKALPFVLVLSVFIVGDRALSYLKSSNEHKAFAEYNQIRSVFNDTLKGQYHGDITLKALDRVGWSPEDYAFFRLWILYDEVLFNPESIKTFTSENDPQNRASALELAANRIKRSLNAGKRYTLVLIFSVLSLFLYRLSGLLQLSRQDKLRVGVALTTVCTGIVFFMYYRFPARLYVPLYCYLLGTVFLLFRLEGGSLEGEKDVPTLRKIGVVASLLLMVVTVGFVAAQGRQILHILEASQTEKEYIHRCLTDVKEKSLHPDPLLVLADPLYGLRFETVHPLRERSDFPDVRVFPGGSRIRSPAYFDALRQIGLKGGREFLRWIIDNDEVLLILMAGKGGRDRNVKYLWESYLSRRIVPGEKVRLVPAHDFRNRHGAGLVFHSIRHAD